MKRERRIGPGNDLLRPGYIVRWSISTRNKYRQQIPTLESTHPGLTVVQVRSQTQVEARLAGPLAGALGPN